MDKDALSGIKNIQNNKNKERSRIRIMSNNSHFPSQPICYSGLERVSLSVSQLLRRFSDDRQKGKRDGRGGCCTGVLSGSRYDVVSSGDDGRSIRQ